MNEKKEIPGAQWLRAIADGEQLQNISRRNGALQWADISNKEAAMLVLNSPDFEGKLRTKPRTIKIGRHDVPESIRVAPKLGVSYFVISTAFNNSVVRGLWVNDELDRRTLEAGMCWLKREDAELAAKAITELLTGVSHD